MKEIKKQLISSFDKIELNTSKLYSTYLENNDLFLLNEGIVPLIADLNVFSKSINIFISSIYLDQDIVSKHMITGSTFKGKMRKVLSKLNSITQQLLNEFRSLNEKISTEKIDDSFINICFLEGEIALSIRFDLLVPPIQEYEDITLDDINNKLEKLNSINRDYIQLNHIWQYSSRRFLPSISLADTAIILQGPIQYEDDFTLETIYRYRKIYPDTLIIVSTWEGEVTTLFRFLASSINVLIIENKKPSDAGSSNINYQLTSTRSGLSAAQEFKDIKYAIKTRSDQCFFLPDFLLYMKNMLKTYKCERPEQEERLLFLGGWNSMCFFPFRISDFMVFGALGDLIRYYSCSGHSQYLDKNYVSPDAINEHISKWAPLILFENMDVLTGYSDEERKQFNENNKNSYDPEGYLLSAFYEKYILKREFTDEDDRLDHYWHFLKDYAIIINADELLLFWHKYEFQKYNWNALVSDGGLTHSFWLSLYLS